MALSITPKFEKDIPLEGLSRQQSLALAVEVAGKLDWLITQTSEQELVLQTPYSSRSGSEQVTVKIEEGYVSVRSETLGSQLADWGTNKKNVESFETTLWELKSSVTTEQLEIKYEELKLLFLVKRTG
jgi:rhomboid protease GluP